MVKFSKISSKEDKTRLIKLIESAEVNKIEIGMELIRLPDDHGWPVHKTGARHIKIK